MASVNKVILVGNLGRDPETRYTTSGDAVTNIRIATTDTWKDKAGEKQEKTEWHSVVFFGRQAEIAGEYLKKGRQIYVEGRLQTRKWQDKEGQDRYTTEIVADRMQMLGNREGGGGGGAWRAVRGGSEPPSASRASGSSAEPARRSKAPRRTAEEKRRRPRRRHSVLARARGQLARPASSRLERDAASQRPRLRRRDDAAAKAHVAVVDAPGIARASAPIAARRTRRASAAGADRSIVHAASAIR